MDYVNLGSTGLKVSRLCLGCMTYGAKSWREWVLEEAEAKPYIRQALDAGINFFDTANVYSDGLPGPLRRVHVSGSRSVQIAVQIAVQLSRWRSPTSTHMSCPSLRP